MIDFEGYTSDKRVVDIREQAAVYEFSVIGFDKILKIKVLKHNLTEQPFVGIANYMIKRGKESSFHQCVSSAATLEDAVGNILRGFLMRYDSEAIDIVKLEDW